MEMLLLPFIWIAFGIICAIIASGKGRSGCVWFLLGMLLGPIGFVLALVMEKNQSALEKAAMDSGKMGKCPYCAELVRMEAIRCRCCGGIFKTGD